ncbi:MAG: hypothetical protein ACI8WB_002858 [Phenylobacterium sp.]|jgi:hypothetical protein
MTINVRLDKHLVTKAKIHAQAQNRTVAQQIEFLAKVGQMMIDNPDLSYGFVSEALLATEEVKQGKVTRYTRRTIRDDA